MIRLRVLTQLYRHCTLHSKHRCLHLTVVTWAFRASEQGQQEAVEGPRYQHSLPALTLGQQPDQAMQPDSLLQASSSTLSQHRKRARHEPPKPRQSQAGHSHGWVGPAVQSQQPRSHPVSRTHGHRPETVAPHQGPQMANTQLGLRHTSSQTRPLRQQHSGRALPSAVQQQKQAGPAFVRVGDPTPVRKASSFGPQTAPGQAGLQGPQTAARTAPLQLGLQTASLQAGQSPRPAGPAFIRIGNPQPGSKASSVEPQAALPQARPQTNAPRLRSQIHEAHLGLESVTGSQVAVCLPASADEANSHPGSAGAVGFAPPAQAFRHVAVAEAAGASTAAECAAPAGQAEAAVPVEAPDPAAPAVPAVPADPVSAARLAQQATGNPESTPPLLQSLGRRKRKKQRLSRTPESSSDRGWQLKALAADAGPSEAGMADLGRDPVVIALSVHRAHKCWRSSQPQVVLSKDQVLDNVSLIQSTSHVQHDC